MHILHAYLKKKIKNIYKKYNIFIKKNWKWFKYVYGILQLTKFKKNNLKVSVLLYHWSHRLIQEYCKNLVQIMSKFWNIFFFC